MDAMDRERNLGYLARFVTALLDRDRVNVPILYDLFCSSELRRLQEKRRNMERNGMETAPYTLLGSDKYLYLDGYEALLMRRIAKISEMALEQAKSEGL